MKMFVVTYKTEFGGIECHVMTGNKLAEKYGFSDCSCEEILRVWEVGNDGNLIPCRFWNNWSAPHNVLCIHRLGNYEPYEYEWAEH